VPSRAALCAQSVSRGGPRVTPGIVAMPLDLDASALFYRRVHHAKVKVALTRWQVSMGTVTTSVTPFTS
jgi:hypothetical protein